MPFGGYFGERERSILAEDGALDLQRVSSFDLASCAKGLERSAEGASSREEAAERIVGYLFDRFCTGTSREPSLALVRCFQTYPLVQLPATRRTFAMRHLGSVPFRDDIRCLTLLATRGLEPQWNRVEDSAGHQAIPLPSVEVILKAPMIARLLLQMGIRYEHVVAPPEGEDLLIGEGSEVLRVFHIARARGSQYIPAQASFVHRYGIRSVLGLGGLLPSGELLVLVMFTRVQVPREIAELFRTLAGAVCGVLARFPAGQTFAVPA